MSVESLNTRKHVTLEAERTKEAVGLVGQKVDRLTALEGAQVDERVRERFLESLKYPGFNQRRNQIDAAYGDTLNWIFVGDNDEDSCDDSGSDEYDDTYEDYDFDSNESGEVDEERESDQALHSDEDHISNYNNGAEGQHGSRDAFNTGASDSAGEASWSTVSDSGVTDSEEDENRDHGSFWEIKWDSFSNWLSSTDVIYWISGKPGSGKTTVVKYILADERTKKYLNIWSPGCAIVSHYFWLPGSPMQRNMEGLLSSLLYQLLENDSSASLQIMSSVSGQKSSYTDWSNDELHSAFIRALDSYKNGVCLFLDGIDEIKPEDGTKADIPEFLNWAIKLSQRNKIKLCLASRPDPHILETRLSWYPRLRLQDLNYSDLMAYAKARVEIPEEAISAEKNDLIQSLADKAEGVFLWLILAIKSVNEGFRNDDSTVTLQERIDCLPQGLDSLYKDMWARAGADNPFEYRQAAALYFKLLLASKVLLMGGVTAFDIMLATTCLAGRVLHALADRSKPVPEDDMLQQYRKVEKKLNIYCVGLIQTVPVSNRLYSNYSWYGHVYDRIYPVATRIRLEFIHRTARDFLTDTKSGREILGFDTSSDFSIDCRLLYARLASLALIPQADNNAETLTESLINTFGRWRHIGRELPQNWNRLVLVCEQLADSGRLWLGHGDFAYHCSGTQFLNLMARHSSEDDDDKLLISRIKNRTLSENEISSFLLAFTRIDKIPSLFRTCREMLRAGADPNWQGFPFWFYNSETRAYAPIHTPWQWLLSSVELVPLGPEIFQVDRTQRPILAELTSLAEVFFLFISEGAKLSDQVNLVFLEQTDPPFGTPPDLQEQMHYFTWNLDFVLGPCLWRHAILTSIPAYMIVKLLTNTLRRCCSTLDEESFPKVCIDLENACESYRSSGTCRVLGKLERLEERSITCFTWWETTNDVQARLGSSLMEWLERQLLLVMQVIEGADISETKRMDAESTNSMDAEKTFQCIWDHESWNIRNREIGNSSICERLIELGFMMRFDGVVEFHSTEEWVRKHILENPQCGGTT